MPQNMSALALSSTSILLSWMPPQRDLINGVLRYYHVLITDLHGEVVYDALVNEDSLDTDVSSLYPYSVYNCSVAAVTVEDGPSTEVQVQTLEDSKTNLFIKTTKLLIHNI